MSEILYIIVFAGVMFLIHFLMYKAGIGGCCGSHNNHNSNHIKEKRLTHKVHENYALESNEVREDNKF
ncbi:hypothetical protein SAMN04244560_01717 [Thermoanaerobacter thermohydrosulfuricus]|uniref:Uncharacterized protein n=2 Tax=Thermoanaerobacter thermohydrosulfuricus TaxID=1516 RepID=M8CWV4_THETY|nr:MULTISPECIES: hypothetical protein [Thermoanaerobacter]EMT38828.1 hypothetical protein TthWC1_1635 [Thermoanaerobacter thermohydrosulfuricus WC1]SDG06290.1 hypothetical protein SAMN04244560_01717 [Thermoanaerobacter thermohydrosulfuricus]SFE21626.1 hypothetical protein SAMN04324257_00968 [Thermoanaerobacter thermohydrosulfuricus]